MGRKKELEDQIALLQAKLNEFNNTPEDIYPLNTVVVFSFSNQRKIHYSKTAEELWRKLGTGTTKSLADWIIDTKELDAGYFEVYVLKTEETPIYASE